MMDSARYALVLLACLAITLPLEVVLGARVYRRPARVVATLLPVALLFAGWDLIAVARGHWTYAPRYVLGPGLLGLPIEEWAFFVVIPLCGLLTYEVLGKLRAPRAGRLAPRRKAGRSARGIGRAS